MKETEFYLAELHSLLKGLEARTKAISEFWFENRIKIASEGCLNAVELMTDELDIQVTLLASASAKIERFRNEMREGKDEE